MKTLFRILGTAAAVAVTGAAIVALDKILNQKDPLHVEEVEFPEEAEQDAAEAEKTAEAYAEAEAKAADDAAEQPTAPAEADAPEAPAEPAPAQEPATLEDTSEESMLRRAEIVFDNLYAFLHGEQKNVILPR